MKVILSIILVLIAVTFAYGEKSYTKKGNRLKITETREVTTTEEKRLSQLLFERRQLMDNKRDIDNRLKEINEYIRQAKDLGIDR